MSDQAFYIPAVVRALNGAAFPRDAALIDAQGRLLVVDELLAAAAGATGLPLDILFFVAYLCSIAVLWVGLVLVGRIVYGQASATAGPRRHWLWATLALAAAFTLRHRIPRTSANSFEPYFHPRMLAFGVGVLAIAAVLRRRRWLAVGLVAAAAAIHVTTAIWFAILIGVALAILDPVMRRLALAAAVATSALLAWALTTGPLRTSMARMDDVWLQAVASKDSLFPTEWPLWAWVGNLALLAVLVAAHRYRRSRGKATREDGALVWGAVSLVTLFLVTLPAVAARLAFPVQLQISRVFWLVDFLATVYVIAVLSDTRAPRFQRRTRVSAAAALAALLIALSAGRGAYILLVEHPERGLFDVHLDDSAWQDAMRWLSRQPLDVHVLADPGHSWKYGTSVRVAAERDVFLEDVKDSAIAIYSRDVAMRVVERSRAVGDFSQISADAAATLAAHYGLDYLVAEQSLPLPVAYRNAQFSIYDLRRHF